MIRKFTSRTGYVLAGVYIVLMTREGVHRWRVGKHRKN